MSKLPSRTQLADLAAVTASSAMTGATYLAIATGLIGLTLLTLGPSINQLRWIEGLLFLALVFFVWEWLVRLVHARRDGKLPAYVLSPRGLVDAVSALAVPLALLGGAQPSSAWLLGVLWVLKAIPEIAGLRQLRRVLVHERGPLLSVAAMFVMVVFMASVVLHVLERDAQPVAFGSIPATLWWAVVTMTTTGYGDVVPITPLGRLVAAFVMISGLAVFGLWIGILATGFASETRRYNFLRTWETVTKVPFFSTLGSAAIADVANMLRRIEVPRRSMLIRKGQIGDCMYFIADGEVEIELPGDKRVQLGSGAFFGEMALFENRPRSANVVTTRTSTLLVLDLVEFRMLMARHPDLAQMIDAEAKRRAQQNA
ncbi:MAG: cyclic nucleotide-binding protein [Proteobacteria bacterium SG_bin9]|nr:MAG: cyclic nucleotide-binding protein [Proteobacteria bacterium SG_bin9]